MASPPAASGDAGVACGRVFGSGGGTLAGIACAVGAGEGTAGVPLAGGASAGAGVFSSAATDTRGVDAGPRSTPRHRGQRSGGWSVAGSVATSEPQCLQLMNMRLLNHAAALSDGARQACLRRPSMRTQSPSRVTANCSNHGR
jgi:hypothetical protein